MSPGSRARQALPRLDIDIQLDREFNKRPAGLPAQVPEYDKESHDSCDSLESRRSGKTDRSAYGSNSSVGSGKSEGSRRSSRASSGRDRDTFKSEDCNIEFQMVDVVRRRLQKVPTAAAYRAIASSSVQHRSNPNPVMLPPLHENPVELLRVGSQPSRPGRSTPPNMRPAFHQIMAHEMSDTDKNASTDHDRDRDTFKDDTEAALLQALPLAGSRARRPLGAGRLAPIAH